MRRITTIILSILGILLILAGGVWFLQGINVIPGSFMTGQIQWAIYGAIAVVVCLRSSSQASKALLQSLSRLMVKNYKAQDSLGLLN